MWLYNDKEFTSEDIGHWKAFVYQITNLTNDKKYIGKKLFHKTRRKPPLKGKTKRRVEISESDWQDYWGSSDALNADVERLGVENFKREIIYLCSTKGEASYYEAALQFEKKVLLREDYYNGIINCRVSARHLPKADDLSKEKS